MLCTPCAMTKYHRDTLILNRRRGRWPRVEAAFDHERWRYEWLLVMGALDSLTMEEGHGRPCPGGGDDPWRLRGRGREVNSAKRNVLRPGWATIGRRSRLMWCTMAVCIPTVRYHQSVTSRTSTLQIHSCPDSWDLSTLRAHVRRDTGQSCVRWGWWQRRALSPLSVMGGQVLYLGRTISVGARRYYTQTRCASRFLMCGRYTLGEHEGDRREMASSNVLECPISWSISVVNQLINKTAWAQLISFPRISSLELQAVPSRRLY